MNLNVEHEFGNIDIYLFDQLLRGRVTPRDRVLDAGCGWGRNLVYLMRQGADVSAMDTDADAVGAVRELAARIAPALPAHNFRIESIEHSTFPDAHATVVISSAVLHFARDDAQFAAMLEGSWRVLASGGMLFCRLASTIGLESRIRLEPGSRRAILPDGTARYLVDEAILMDWTRRLRGKLLDPIKTTVVQDQRSMTTWVVRKD